MIFFFMLYRVKKDSEKCFLYIMLEHKVITTEKFTGD